MKFALYTLVILCGLSKHLHSQDDPMRNLRAMYVTNKSKIDKNQSIYVTSESKGKIAGKLTEISEQILLIEQLLTEHKFKVIPNTHVLNAGDDFYESKTEIESPFKDSIANSFYVLTYSVEWLFDITLPIYLLKVVIYEKETKRIIAKGELEDRIGRIRNNFEEHIERFIQDLEYQ